MRYLVFFAFLSVAAAKPKPDGWGGWDAGLSLGHDDWAAPQLTLAHSAPVVQAAPVIQAAPVVQAAPVIHAAPVVHAPVAVKAATSYSSFQRIIHPIAHTPVVHAPVVQAVHAPVVQAVHAPVVQAVHSAPLIQQLSLGHGW